MKIQAKDIRKVSGDGTAGFTLFQVTVAGLHSNTPVNIAPNMDSVGTNYAPQVEFQLGVSTLPLHLEKYFQARQIEWEFPLPLGRRLKHRLARLWLRPEVVD